VEARQQEVLGSGCDPRQHSPVNQDEGKYVRRRKVIERSFRNLDSLTKHYDYVSDESCVAQKKAFADDDSFTKH
jgi:hypothetical protein